MDLPFLDMNTDNVRSGFQPIDCKWRHFALADEPCPNICFKFSVSSEAILRKI